MRLGCDAPAAGGVPLGGIGAGKVELDARGRLVNITIMNNWSRPVKEMAGFHVLVAPDDGEPFFLQCGLPLMPRLGRLSVRTELEARWPVARLRGGRGSVAAELEAFSPIVPGDLKDSSLPAVMLRVWVRGSRSGRVAVSMTNLVGKSNVGRANVAVRGGFKAVNARADPYDHSRGDMTLVSDDAVSVIAQYNVNVERNRAPRVCGLGPENEAPWESVIEGSAYRGDSGEASGSNYLPAGIVVSRYDHGSPATFVMAWHFNQPSELFPYEHYYANFFRDSEEVARYLLEEGEGLLAKTLEWQERLVDPSLPEWLRDAIVNSAYILSSSTWLTRDGRFAIYEAPEHGPMMTTIGGATYEAGSLPVVLMFPELERSTLEQLARHQRPDGYVPHDLGTDSLDAPSDGTTAPPGWKDLAPTFILLVYRYYRRTGDLGALRSLYGAALRAYRWELAQDVDGDGLPEAAGSGDTSFDCVPLAGKVSYVSSLWIASLLALREMARALGDGATEAEVEGRIRAARESFRRLVRGGRARAWTDGPEPDRGGVMLAQSFGDWWAYLLGLEPVLDEATRSAMLGELLSTSARASQRCGAPNVVAGLPWSPVYAYDQLNSSWPRLVFAISALGYGVTGDLAWLEVARREWDNLVAQGLQWNQPSLVHCDTGRPDENFLDHYIGSAALWSFTYRYALKALGAPA